MPFEHLPPAPQKIAVVGAGISGMGAAHLLGDRHDVTLFESESRLGGHARTVKTPEGTAVDTGFIVFNHPNYPHLTRLFADLEVPTEKSDMSFGVTIDGGRLEYSLRTVAALFAQRRRALDPGHWGMIRDILRFNARAFDASRGSGLTIAELVAELGLGDRFLRCYILPISGAIWSTPTSEIGHFPAETLLSFFKNHALLSTNTHQWHTVSGGSVEYVRRMGSALVRQGVQIRLAAPIETVRRGPDGVQIRAGGAWDRFDQVVFACHSDQALRLLETPDPEEAAALGAIRYQPNRVVLHQDVSQMPRRRAAWGAWVYQAETGEGAERIGVTYWMNRLQNLPMTEPLFVTLNPVRPIDPAKILNETELAHPLFDAGALAAQAQITQLQGLRRTWFCGAWLRNGFHEDGLWSAHQVADRLAALPAAA